MTKQKNDKMSFLNVQPSAECVAKRNVQPSAECAAKRNVQPSAECGSLRLLESYAFPNLL